MFPLWWENNNYVEWCDSLVIKISIDDEVASALVLLLLPRDSGDWQDDLHWFGDS